MSTGGQALTVSAVGEAIRKSILAGDFAPGQRLVETELCASLGASRGTVRSALVDLTHEGLVERIANQGARVRVVTVEEAKHITEVRILLEGLCAAKAAEHASSESVAALRLVGDQMIEAVGNGDIIGYSELNQRLHLLIIDLAQQPVAAEILGRLRARNVRHQFRLAYRAGRAQASLPQHLSIIDAIEGGNPAAAEGAMHQHLADVLAELDRVPS